MSEPRRWLPGDLLLHPAALGAMAVWFVNDHVLKFAAPGWISGKLSDVACLAAFPLLLLASVELARPTWARQRRFPLLWTSLSLTGAIMVSINLSELAATGYQWGLGLAQWPLRIVVSALTRGASVPTLSPVVLTMDPSDLWTLPALLVAAWVGISTHPDRRDGTEVGRIAPECIRNGTSA